MTFFLPKISCSPFFSPLTKIDYKLNYLLFFFKSFYICKIYPAAATISLNFCLKLGRGVIWGPNQIVGFVFDIPNTQSFYSAVFEFSDHPKQKCHIAKSTEPFLHNWWRNWIMLLWKRAVKEYFFLFLNILCVYLWCSVVAGYRSGRETIKDIYRAAILTDDVNLQLEFVSLPDIWIVN